MRYIEDISIAMQSVKDLQHANKVIEDFELRTEAKFCCFKSDKGFGNIGRKSFSFFSKNIWTPKTILSFISLLQGHVIFNHLLNLYKQFFVRSQLNLS